MKPIFPMHTMNRRHFLASGTAMTASLITLSRQTGLFAQSGASTKLRVALVGTGIRGITMWGKSLLQDYGDMLTFTGLCDINPGRLQYAKEFIGCDCPTFTDFDAMLQQCAIDCLIVTTVDATHHEFIVKGLKSGKTVITEKPMTTDEIKCQAIIDAEQSGSGKLIVAFNYRYGLLFTELKETLEQQKIGKLTSIDFNWYLNNYHGASYFRRWHGYKDKGGTLLLHKAAHHFDLINWFVGSDPVEVHAYGALDYYGKNSSFRGEKCRGCAHAKRCDYFWDITKEDRMMRLYVDHEHLDGYIRDNCLFRESIDIYDKMAVQVRYANGVQVSYSLTTYSPFEGFRIAFNGTLGRTETWEGLPWLEKNQLDQAALHELEMAQSQAAAKEAAKYHEIITSENFGEIRVKKLPFVRSAHWGGDPLMKDHIFRSINPPKHFGQEASLHEGVMGVLVGIAARKSIEENRPVSIGELTSLQPVNAS